jgi:hypothetical protein
MIPKKIILLSLILLVAVSSIIACDKKPQPHKKLTSEQIRKIDEDFYMADAVLLSYKYNIDTQKVLGLLIDLDHDRRHDLTKDKLLGYSQKYQIKTSVMAAIIIDSKYTTCPDCTCDCGRDSDQ